MVSFLVVTHSQDFMVYWVIIAIYFHEDHQMNFLWMPARSGMTGILSFPRKRESMKKYNLRPCAVYRAVVCP
jgi:hypothetical protein